MLVFITTPPEEHLAVRRAVVKGALILDLRHHAHFSLDPGPSLAFCHTVEREENI